MPSRPTTTEGGERGGAVRWGEFSRGRGKGSDGLLDRGGVGLDPVRLRGLRERVGRALRIGDRSWGWSYGGFRWEAVAEPPLLFFRARRGYCGRIFQLTPTKEEEREMAYTQVSTAGSRGDHPLHRLAARPPPRHYHSFCLL